MHVLEEQFHIGPGGLCAADRGACTRRREAIGCVTPNGEPVCVTDCCTGVRGDTAAALAEQPTNKKVATRAYRTSFMVFPEGQDEGLLPHFSIDPRYGGPHRGPCLRRYAFLSQSQGWQGEISRATDPAARRLENLSPHLGWPASGLEAALSQPTALPPRQL